jgi:hypothetical protein
MGVDVSQEGYDPYPIGLMWCSHTRATFHGWPSYCFSMLNTEIPAQKDANCMCCCLHAIMVTQQAASSMV